VNFVIFVANFFSSRHKGTKTLRKNNKIKSFVSGLVLWWQIFLGFGLSGLGIKYFEVEVITGQ